MVTGRQGRVQIRRDGRGGTGESGGERGCREIRAPAPAGPRRVRGRM